jgi:hypothetical protein
MDAAGLGANVKCPGLAHRRGLESVHRFLSLDQTEIANLNPRSKSALQGHVASSKIHCYVDFCRYHLTAIAGVGISFVSEIAKAEIKTKLGLL